MTGFIYLLAAFHTKLLKLGWTDNFSRRLSQIRRGNADSISVAWVAPGSHETEREMHRSPDLQRYHDHDEFYRDEPGARETIASLLPVEVNGSDASSAGEQILPEGLGQDFNLLVEPPTEFD